MEKTPFRRCQVERQSATMRPWNQTIEVTVSRRKSSVMAVWLYHRFTLSFRDVEDLLSERGIIVSYAAIRFWCLKFGPGYARSIRKKRGRLGDIWHVDELCLKINGRQVCLWRAVDQDGDFSIPW